MHVLAFAITLAAIEILLLWGKIAVDKEARKRLDNSLTLLVPSAIPWWVGWYRKFWFVFHFPVIAVLIPITVFYASIGKNGQLVVPDEYFHGLNFLILTGCFAWLAI